MSIVLVLLSVLELCPVGKWNSSGARFNKKIFIIKKGKIIMFFNDRRMKVKMKSSFTKKIWPKSRSLDPPI